MKEKCGLQSVKNLLTAQIICCVVLVLIFLLFSSKKNAISAVFAGGVAIIPSVLFAQKLFKYQGARAAQQIVKSFYLAEALKIFSSIALFTLVFMLIDVAPFAFFFTYIALVMTHWFAPVFFANKQNKVERD